MKKDTIYRSIGIIYILIVIITALLIANKAGLFGDKKIPVYYESQTNTINETVQK